jgi:hypothetical protein
LLKSGLLYADARKVQARTVSSTAWTSSALNILQQDHRTVEIGCGPRIPPMPIHDEAAPAIAR